MRANLGLGIGTNVQAYDPDLIVLAGNDGSALLNVSSIGLGGFYDDAALRARLGLGALAVKSSVADGDISGVNGAKISGAGTIAADRIAAGALGTNVVASSVALNSVYDGAITGMSSSKLSGAVPEANLANAALKAGDTMTGGLTFNNVSGAVLGASGTTPGINISTSVFITAGNLGVGTAAPGAKLHVSSAGAAAADTIFQVSSGTAAGQELVVVKGNGNIGIGEVNPWDKLVVRQAQGPSLSLKTDSLSLSDYNDPNWSRDFQINIWSFDYPGLSFRSSTIYSWPFVISPRYNSGNPYFQFFNWGTWNRIGLAAEWLAVSSADEGQIPSTNITLGAGDLYVQDELEVDGKAYLTGNVGIGTTSPAAKLHVNPSAGALGIQVSADGGNGIQISNTGGNGINSIITGSGNAGYFSSTSGYGLIVNTGNVGIGTTAPGQALEVNGGARLNTAAAQPACSVTTRGTFWVVQGGAGVKDNVQVCAKDAVNAYAWRTLY